MSAKASRWAVTVIAAGTIAMMGYVVLRTELLELSYAIQEQNKNLKESREELRTLRFEVGQEKALGHLDSLSAGMTSPLGQPARVNHLAIAKASVPVVDAKQMAFPQNFFSFFSMVPDAFAKTDDSKS